MNQEKIRLFCPKTEDWTPEGKAISNEIEAILTPFYERASAANLSFRDLNRIVEAVNAELALAHLLKWQTTLKQQT